MIRKIFRSDVFIFDTTTRRLKPEFGRHNRRLIDLNEPVDRFQVANIQIEIHNTKDSADDQFDALKNESFTDFSDERNAQAMLEALEHVESQMAANIQ